MASTGRIAFLLMGLGLAGGLVFLFDTLWKNRFHSVRRPLVDAGIKHVHQHASPSGRPSSASERTTPVHSASHHHHS